MVESIVEVAKVEKSQSRFVMNHNCYKLFLILRQYQLNFILMKILQNCWKASKQVGYTGWNLFKNQLQSLKINC